MHSTVGEIRRRLLFLLLLAFGIVLLLSFLFFTFTLGYFLTSSSTPIPLPFSSTLEGYYLAKGNWDGVESVFDSIRGFDSRRVLLLDADHRIILDRRKDAALPAGSTFLPQNNDRVLNLNVQGKLVGYLVFTPYTFTQRFGFARALLFPVGIVSFILALFLVIVATLLFRRFVNPLADVIYAARSVASGKLDTRISTAGPQDLRSLSESFNEMAASLERSDRERRDMLADIAHELRTPLSVIRGRLEGIVDGIYPENGPQVSMALEQTYAMQRLVDDLRLLTLVETRQLPFDKRDVNLGDVINRVIDMFSAEAQEKQISLTFPEKNGDLTAFIDPQRFEQVIGNLLGNALRYVPEGGKVWVTANKNNGSLRITVNDNGPGIPEEDLPFIFDRFWRKDRSRSRISGGSGLGLAIAKQLVEAQDGTIAARNIPEGGLQVTVELKNKPAS
jgi:two-component system OmpR family sensor kinase/two-component system sensor histidine kinase BaeS